MTRAAPDWHAEAIGLREAKHMTYQEIGDKFGVTRERVRQVLQENGRQDLCHLNWNRGRLSRGNCSGCGASMKGKPARQKFCSNECYSRYTSRTLTAREQHIISVVHEMRTSNPPATWKQISVELGWTSGTVGASKFVKACKKVGLDPYVIIKKRGR